MVKTELIKNFYFNNVYKKQRGEMLAFLKYRLSKNLQNV